MMKAVSDWNEPPAVSAPPDFGNLLAVLRRERPSRPTLFELFLNGPLYRKVAGPPDPDWPSDMADYLTTVRACARAGYDYTVFWAPGGSFPVGEVRKAATRSLNEGAVITDRASFDACPWPEPDAADYSVVDKMASYLPPRMKLILAGPGGVLENTIQLVGYERLCVMLVDDEPLACDIFEAVGSRLLRYYRRAIPHPAVGAIIGNDDWGFKSQTMISPKDMRRFVFPWYKEIVLAAHGAGKPAILHSCGCLAEVMDDVIDDMKFDARHSYEDTIQPVEAAYDAYHDRIAILGGIDVDFICRSAPEEVYLRSKKMLERAEKDGAYALGSGNSIPDYVPDAAYFAMIRAALDLR